MADAEWRSGMVRDTKLNCFIKLKAVLPGHRDLTKALWGGDPFEERLKRLSIKDGIYTAWAARPKLRYIGWIDDTIERAVAFIRYPFQRT